MRSDRSSQWQFSRLPGARTLPSERTEDIPKALPMESTMQRTWQLVLLVGLVALGSRWFSGVRADEKPQNANDGPTRVALVDMVRLFKSLSAVRRTAGRIEVALRR